MSSAIGTVLSSPYRILNVLLPFTKAGTPLYQDVLHTAVLCTLLYFAPHYLEVKERRQHQHQRATTTQPPAIHRDIALDEQEEGPDADDVDFDDVQNGDGILLRHQNQEDDANDQAHPENPALPHQQGVQAPRVVSTKKARSLARRDQRRAYNEFIRSQGDAARAAAAAEAARDEASAAQERTRRSAAVAAAEARLAEERKASKEAAQRSAAREEERTRKIVTIVKKGLDDYGLVDIRMDVIRYVDAIDVRKVERIVRAAGIEGTKICDNGRKVLTMITRKGLVVRVDAELMREVYDVMAALSNGADSHYDGADDIDDGAERRSKAGKVTWENIGDILESKLHERRNSKFDVGVGDRGYGFLESLIPTKWVK